MNKGDWGLSGDQNSYDLYIWFGFEFDILKQAVDSQALFIQLFTENAEYKNIHTVGSQPCKTNKKYTKNNVYKEIH